MVRVCGSGYHFTRPAWRGTEGPGRPMAATHQAGRAAGVTSSGGCGQGTRRLGERGSEASGNDGCNGGGGTVADGGDSGLRVFCGLRWGGCWFWTKRCCGREERANGFYTSTPALGVPSEWRGGRSGQIHPFPSLPAVKRGRYVCTSDTKLGCAGVLILRRSPRVPVPAGPWAHAVVDGVVGGPGGGDGTLHHAEGGGMWEGAPWEGGGEGERGGGGERPGRERPGGGAPCGPSENHM